MINPTQYQPLLSVNETQEAIRIIRDKFQKELGKQLNLTRVSAPLFLPTGSGLNDDLNGIERKVSFDAKAIEATNLEVVQSLAKWKRYALAKYGYTMHKGLFTNMNAIRRDEAIDNLHSIYVDQWDWEKVISENDRTIEFLKATVNTIYKVIKHMEHEVWYVYPHAVYPIPDELTFIDSQDLLDRYPDLDGKQRENKICKQYGAVFILRIGAPLSNGKPHDGRAPDYDDWQLNGDLLIWYEPLQCAIELSSMGIRVNADSIAHQCKIAGVNERLQLPYHQSILHHQLPYSIGGGIGQSRLCMLLLQKIHIGEVQASVWDQKTLDLAKRLNIPLL